MISNSVKNDEHEKDGRITFGGLLFLQLSTAFLLVTGIYSTLSVRPAVYQYFVGGTSLMVMVTWYLLVIATTPRYILVTGHGIFFKRLLGLRLESIENAQDATIESISETLNGDRRSQFDPENWLGIQIRPRNSWHINVVRGFTTNAETLIERSREFFKEPGHNG